MPSNDRKPLGAVFIPAVLCALTGTILSVSLELMGYFSKLSLLLSKFWENEPFYLVDPYEFGQEENWFVTFLFCLLVGVLILSSASTWRRLLVGIMFLLVLVVFSPTLMLWQILWLPMMSLVAFLWTWVCAFIYCSQHEMPCDISIVKEAEIRPEVETTVKKAVK